MRLLESTGTVDTDSSIDFFGSFSLSFGWGNLAHLEHQSRMARDSSKHVFLGPVILIQDREINRYRHDLILSDPSVGANTTYGMPKSPTQISHLLKK